jgi:hypothetical protein
MQYLDIDEILYKLKTLKIDIITLGRNQGHGQY